MIAMTSIAEQLERPAESAAVLLELGEDILAHWVAAHGVAPTSDTREGFRLLALHRQGAKNDPSFNACRETCRELAYHYNLLTTARRDGDGAARLAMMRFVARHLYFFVSGKLEEAALGDFCCSSKSIRSGAN